jgi:hypothetical protein
VAQLAMAQDDGLGSLLGYVAALVRGVPLRARARRLAVWE